MALNGGDKDKAKKILVDLRKQLHGGDVIKSTNSFEFIKIQVDDLLRSIDPSLVPAGPNLQGGRITEAQLRELQERLRKARAQGKLPPLPVPATSSPAPAKKDEAGDGAPSVPAKPGKPAEKPGKSAAPAASGK
jgi:hypothetical protein